MVKLQITIKITIQNFYFKRNVTDTYNKEEGLKMEDGPFTNRNL